MPPRYSCEYPGCTFETGDRSLVDKHHIIPRGEKGSSNLPRNILTLCPNHHRLIFVPSAKRGQHAIQQEGSIVIISKLLSNKGSVLEYLRCSDGKSFYFFYRDKETWEK